MAEFVVPPVLEQQGRFRSNTPVVGIGDGSPLVDIPANFVDSGGDVVLLLCRGKTLPLVEDQLLLASTTRPALLPRLGNGRDELGPPAILNDLLGWLSSFVQLPVPAGIFVWGVQYRSVVERVLHVLHR